MAVSIKPTCCVDASRAGPAHQTGRDPHAKSLLLSGQYSPAVHSLCLVMQLAVGMSGLSIPFEGASYNLYLVVCFGSGCCMLAVADAVIAVCEYAPPKCVLHVCMHAWKERKHSGDVCRGVHA